MKYMTQWHPEHNVPIVDGKFQNPNMGEIQELDRKETYSGPPSVHVIWFNVHDTSTFRGIGATFSAAVDDVLIVIMDHVGDGVYTITGLNATAYSLTVVCSTPRSQEEVGQHVQNMQVDLGKDVVLPPDEVEAFQNWEREMREREKEEKESGLLWRWICRCWLCYRIRKEVMHKIPMDCLAGRY